jgi:hypothetical protein
MLKALFKFICELWANYIGNNKVFNSQRFNELVARQLAWSAGGRCIDPASVKAMERDHGTTFFVKEYIIVGKGRTYVWWTAKDVMNYQLHKIVYHTGDTVYFHSDNKVLWVIDVDGKRWT